MKVVIGITGASGSIYGRRLAEVLLHEGHSCHLIVSEAGKVVVAHELDEEPAQWPSVLPGGSNGLRLWDDRDLLAPFCSGSHSPDAMVVVPCSMGSLSRIAAGTADTLLTRTADVCLKERRPLLLVVREMPINLIHIENMGRVTRAGGIILPASPAFYHRPSRIEDLVNFVVGKIMNGLGMPQRLFTPWGDETG